MVASNGMRRIRTPFRFPTIMKTIRLLVLLAAAAAISIFGTSCYCYDGYYGGGFHGGGYGGGYGGFHGGGYGAPGCY